MSEYCLGPCTKQHFAPPDGQECPICTEEVLFYEKVSCRIFDHNGPNICYCPACGEPIQYWKSHERECEPLNVPQNFRLVKAR